jgi:hypothetical protein
MIRVRRTINVKSPQDYKRARPQGLKGQRAGARSRQTIQLSRVLVHVWQIFWGEALLFEQTDETFESNMLSEA